MENLKSKQIIARAVNFKTAPSEPEVTNFGLGMLLPALILFGIFFFVLIGWGILSQATKTPLNEIYLLPWVGLAALVIVTPTVILLYRQKLDVFHPLVFAAWSYFFPAFVVGGLVLTFGIFTPPFLHLIENPEYNLPLTFVYIALGYAGLSAGFALPWGRKCGEWLSLKAIPKWDWTPPSIVFPSILLLAIGLFFYLSAWFAGSIGYQQIDFTNSLSSASFFFALIALEASLMLWLFLFKTPKISLFHIVSFVILMGMVLLQLALSGNKGTLLAIVILIAIAFVYSGRKLKFRQAVFFGVAGIIAVLIGVVYGTTFRQLRGSEAKTSIVDYTDQVGQAVEIMLTQDPTKTLGDGLAATAERIEIASSLAVIVSNYEKLAPYEAAYGLENNIWTYTWTAFIPRFIWNDKPIVSDARGYSELYFNYGDTSFAMTPMGDLLRNFGPVGIPFGMMLLGFVMRIVYAALIENQTVTIGRVAAYYMILTNVSYEGFYGTILPSLIRVAFVAALSLIFINFLAGSRRRN